MLRKGSSVTNITAISTSNISSNTNTSSGLSTTTSSPYHHHHRRQQHDGSHHRSSSASGRESVALHQQQRSSHHYHNRSTPPSSSAILEGVLPSTLPKRGNHSHSTSTSDISASVGGGISHLSPSRQNRHQHQHCCGCACSGSGGNSNIPTLTSSRKGSTDEVINSPLSNNALLRHIVSSNSKTTIIPRSSSPRAHSPHHPLVLHGSPTNHPLSAQLLCGGGDCPVDSHPRLITNTLNPNHICNSGSNNKIWQFGKVCISKCPTIPYTTFTTNVSYVPTCLASATTTTKKNAYSMKMLFLLNVIFVQLGSGSKSE